MIRGAIYRNLNTYKTYRLLELPILDGTKTALAVYTRNDPKEVHATWARPVEEFKRDFELVMGVEVTGHVEWEDLYGCFYMNDFSKKKE